MITAERAERPTVDPMSDPASSPPSNAPPSSEVDVHLMAHAYDGIREYDNPLPGWWSWIFIGTIVFAGFYGLYFHVVGWGTTPDERYQAALARYDAKHADRERADLANVSEEYLEHQGQNGPVVARGTAVFAERCASCHGARGEGLIGPNLTDGHQLHGTTRLDIYRTIRGGVAGTAMLAWGDQLPGPDVVAAATYAIALRGTFVRGKPPEGRPVQPFSP